MFTKLRIQNFKSWADTGEFRMAPLTGFFGTNSSGKTAILQFLLMLKQTVESSDRNRILHLGGGQYSYVDLGTNYDISHRHQLPEKIKFSFEWIPRNMPDHIVYMIMEVDFKENGQIEFTPNKYTSSLKFESEINVDNDQINLEYFKYSFKASDNQWNHIAINSQTENDVETIYKLSVDGSFLENWLAFEYSNFSKFMYVFNQLVNNYSV